MAGRCQKMSTLPKPMTSKIPSHTLLLVSRPTAGDSSLSTRRGSTRVDAGRGWLVGTGDVQHFHAHKDK